MVQAVRGCDSVRQKGCVLKLRGQKSTPKCLRAKTCEKLEFESLDPI
jgi:hypothetical protein